MADVPRLVLASRSPRRADLLRAAGYTFVVDAVDVDESERAGETAEVYVERLAIEKASAIAGRWPGVPVVGADTTVVVDGEVLGKPADAADATRMLGRLSGRGHLVHTGVAVVRDRLVRSGVATTAVSFAALGDAEIADYVRSGEPMDKAGVYGIQGGAARFVTAIDGPLDTVIGLPVPLVAALLADFPESPTDDRAGGPAKGRPALPPASESA